MEFRKSSHMAQNAPVADRRSISAPARHDGIGNALRAAFEPKASGLPDELARLLMKLD